MKLPGAPAGYPSGPGGLKDVFLGSGAQLGALVALLRCRGTLPGAEEVLRSLAWPPEDPGFVPLGVAWSLMQASPVLRALGQVGLCPGRILPGARKWMVV